MLVDGIDVRELRREDLWKLIGFVFRRTPSCSAARSPAMSAMAMPTRTMSRSSVALEIAQANEFVTELEDGINSPIDQGGTNVSGGQRQRLAIARAPCKARTAATSSTTASAHSTSAPILG